MPIPRLLRACGAGPSPLRPQGPCPQKICTGSESHVHAGPSVETCRGGVSLKWSLILGCGHRLFGGVSGAAGTAIPMQHRAGPPADGLSSHASCTSECSLQSEGGQRPLSCGPHTPLAEGHPEGALSLLHFWAKSPPGR